MFCFSTFADLVSRSVETNHHPFIHKVYINTNYLPRLSDKSTYATHALSVSWKHNMVSLDPVVANDALLWHHSSTLWLG